MSQSPRDDTFDPNDLGPPAGGAGQNEPAETDGESAPQTDEGEDQRPNRRQSLGNRLSYINRKVAEQERVIYALRAEIEADRQRNTQAQSAYQVAQHVGEAEAVVQRQIETLTERLGKALADGEAVQAAAINRDLAALSVRQARLQEHRDTVAARQREPQPQQQPGGGAPQQPPHVMEWADDNSDWFNMRPVTQAQAVMTQKALQIEQELHAKGYEMASPRMLNAISQRMLREFPEWFLANRTEDRPAPKPVPGTVEVDVPTGQPPAMQVPQQPRPTMPAASRYAPANAGGSGAAGGKKQVRLTPDQQRFAREMGMSDVQYASMLLD